MLIANTEPKAVSPLAHQTSETGAYIIEKDHNSTTDEVLHRWTIDGSPEDEERLCDLFNGKVRKVELAAPAYLTGWTSRLVKKNPVTLSNVSAIECLGECLELESPVSLFGLVLDVWTLYRVYSESDGEIYIVDGSISSSQFKQRRIPVNPA